MARVALLLAFALVAASAGTAADDEINARLSELERLVKAQQGLIAQQQGEISNLKSTRRLQGDAVSSELASMASAMDHIWLLLCGSLVMFMQCGFAMLEAGSCREKNTQNILLKNLTDVCIGTVGWWAFGYALAYGNPDTDGDGKLDNDFAGTENWFATGFMESGSDGQITPAGGKMLAWYFQWAFCATAATIVSGGVAERVRFPGYCIYSFVMTSFIYPIVVAWTWGYGWLEHVNDIGYMDFAGSGIVHLSGGIGALVGAIVAGPREGRWERPEEFVPHNFPLVVLGTMVLWFGWYGFNCGSTLGLSSGVTGELAAQVAMNTTLAASFGCLMVFVIRLVMTRGKYDLAAGCNGILAGLVSITAGCGNVDSGSAAMIGLLGGCIYVGASNLIKTAKIDDPLDAFAVHGACGAWGVLAAALFDWGVGFDSVHGWNGFSCAADENGACKTGLGGQLIAANLLEIVMVALWVGGLSVLLFMPLRVTGLLMAPLEAQLIGMDAHKHSHDKAYTIGLESRGSQDDLGETKI